MTSHPPCNLCGSRTVNLVEFLTYLLTYVSNLIRILVSSSKLRKTILVVVVVVVVGRWFS